MENSRRFNKDEKDSAGKDNNASSGRNRKSGGNESADKSGISLDTPTSSRSSSETNLARGRGAHGRNISMTDSFNSATRESPGSFVPPAVPPASPLVPRASTASAGASFSSPIMDRSSAKFIGIGAGEPSGYKCNQADISNIYMQLMTNADAHFDPTVQGVNEVLEEVRMLMPRLKSAAMSTTEVIDVETQIERMLNDAVKVRDQLQRFIDDTTALVYVQRTLTPRTVTNIRTREAIVIGLTNSIRDVRTLFLMTLETRNREALLPQFDGMRERSSRRQKDSEELVSNSTERMMQSKRILMQVTQTSNATLSELATSSQAIQNNNKELGNQSEAVGGAKSLLTKYGRRARTDQLLMWLAFVLFIVVVLFVMYRRLI